MSVIPGFQDAVRSRMLSSWHVRQSAMAACFMAALAVGGCAHQPTIVGGLTATQIAMLKEDDFVLNDDGWNLNLSAKLLFGTDADSISAASTTSITTLAQSLRSVGIERVIIMGYTDAEGSDAHNLALSERRAEAVASAMMASGMLQQNIQIVPMGKQRPIADNRTAAGRAQNRRVVIVVPAK
jgi:outer membrane protein OmpA-like peptidoglycan-associated protein